MNEKITFDSLTSDEYESFLEWADEQIDKYTISKLDDERFNEYLDDVYSPIDVCGMEMCASYVLKTVDPIAYRTMKSDFEEEVDVYVCPICQSEYGEDENIDCKDEAISCCQNDLIQRWYIDTQLENEE